MRLLKYGRHFRLPDGSKIIVGRDKSENDKLAQMGKGYGKFQMADTLGPLTLAPKGLPEETKRLVASITRRYSRGKGNSSVAIRHTEDGEEDFFEVAAASDEDLARWRIG